MGSVWPALSLLRRLAALHQHRNHHHHVLIQNSQNRSGAAIQIKLDEIILASKAQNTFVGIELLTEEELADLRSKVESRAKEEGP
jgi:low affinity Fe/Cu permease